MTIREATATGAAALKAADIKTFSLDVSLLLAEVTGINRAGLIASSEEQLSEKHTEKFWEFIERRINGCCIAYILGRKEFYGLDFAVNQAVLVPRPDTETLVETALKELGIRNEKLGINCTAPAVLDLCTGSGAVAIALKHEMPELDMWAADISTDALEVAKANARHLLPPESIHFCQGNLFEALESPSNHPSSPIPRFSLIISNPPYVPSRQIDKLAAEVRCEPRLALDGGNDGLDIIRSIVCGAPSYLCPGGHLLLEADPRQMDDIASLLEQSGFCGIRTYLDLSGQQRVIGAVGK